MRVIEKKARYIKVSTLTHESRRRLAKVLFFTGGIEKKVREDMNGSGKKVMYGL